MMRKIIIFFVVSFLLNTINSFADTIYFKDGKVIKSEVISKDDLYTTIRKDGMPQRFPNYKIDRIEKEKIEVIPAMNPEKISDKKELIRLLLDANGSRAAMENNFKAIIAKAQPDKKDKLQSILDINKIMDLLIPVYDKHFDEEELRDLIKFYQSPAGAKLLTITPTIFQESMAASVQYFKDMESQLK